MTYSVLINGLLETGIPFKEGGWQDAHKLRQDYGVYALDNHVDLLSDDRHSDRFLEGTIDLFTLRSNGADKAAEIEAVLENVGAIWRLNAGPMYESDTGYTHWEWVFDVLPDHET